MLNKAYNNSMFVQKYLYKSYSISEQVKPQTSNIKHLKHLVREVNDK